MSWSPERWRCGATAAVGSCGPFEPVDQAVDDGEDRSGGDEEGIGFAFVESLAAYTVTLFRTVTDDSELDIRAG